MSWRQAAKYLDREKYVHQVRLWEITADRKLSEIPSRYTSLEQWIEDWLADDVSVLDPSLLTGC